MISLSKVKGIYLFFILISCLSTLADDLPSYLRVYTYNGGCTVNGLDVEWVGDGHGYSNYSYKSSDDRYASMSVSWQYDGDPTFTYPSHYNSIPVRSCGTYESGDFPLIKNINKVIIPNGVLVVTSLPGSAKELELSPSVQKFSSVYASGLKSIKFSTGCKTFSVAGCRALEHIEIPSSVIELGQGALGNCGIRDLYIPETVQYVGMGLCSGCGSLTNVVFNAPTYIHSSSFRDCTSLKKIVLGDQVKGICTTHWMPPAWAWGTVLSPFDNCTALETAVFGSKIGGVLRIDLFQGCKSLRDLKCRGNVTGIGNNSFSGCYSLTNIVSAAAITSIGDNGLYNCQKLSNRVFDTSKCKTFGANACSRCYAFNDTLDLTSATSVGNSAFSECTNIKEVNCRNKVITIPQYAFSSCSSLTNVLLSANLKSIGNYAFYRCSKLNNVIIPENVTYIGTNAFQSCSSLKKVFFNGKPPSATSAFTSIASNAHGYYLSRYKFEWQSVIDMNGKWNGLIMEEQASPILEVSGASIPYDTLTLNWTYTSNDAVKYSLYRNTENNFSSASLIATGPEIASGTYVESAFMGITPQTASLHYWIVAENQATGETTSDHVEARRRFLLSVGYSAYANGNTAYVQSYRDASLFRSSCTSRGGFQTANTVLAYNSNATTKKIREHMKDFATRAQPGDLFVFYIATHGGDFRKKVLVPDQSEPASSALLLTYDNSTPYYYIEELQDDIRNFNSGVAIVAIVMSCHSQSLTGALSGRNWVDAWIASCGFGQCLGNVSWIASCDSSQSSYNSSTYTMFGQAFIRDGFNRGCADGELFGTSYAGGNNDKLITFKELGLYAKEFAQGLSEDKPADVQMENPDLLDRIVAGNKTSNYYFSRPNPPCNIVADQGKFVSKISVGWDVVDDATEYRIYRTPVKQGSTRKWIGRNVGYSNTSFDDDSVTLLRTEYNYQIQAVNPVGFSELSTAVSGWRGTPYYLSLIDSYYHQLTGASVDVDSVSYSDKENATAMNGYSLGASYIAGLDPTNETSKFTAKITISNGVPSIVWTPDLGSNRTYTIYGKTDLTDSNWTSPTNSSHRFFKVGVELPE